MRDAPGFEETQDLEQLVHHRHARVQRQLGQGLFQAAVAKLHRVPEQRLSRRVVDLDGSMPKDAHQPRHVARPDEDAHLTQKALGRHHLALTRLDAADLERRALRDPPVVDGVDGAEAALGAIVREKVEGIEGLTDLRVEEITGLPQVKAVVDRAAAGRVGLTPGDVIEALRVGLVGEVVSEVRVGQRRYDLVVRLPDHRRGDINALRALLVDGHDGSRIPLGKLAEISQTVGPSAIKREAGSRRIAIEGSVVGRDLGAVADEVNVRLKGLTLPTGSFISVGGRIESQERASAALVSAVAVAVAGVFVLLLLALGTAWEAATILLTLPVALVGGVLALWITGETWNVSSMVGIIGLFGIAVQNGLVLVSQVRGLREEGLDELSSLREASLGRVRPKLMTAGTAVLGLLPILVLNLRGTEIERPLAIVMTGGLVTSTLFTLIALPAVYRLVEGWLSRRGAAP